MTRARRASLLALAVAATAAAGAGCGRARDEAADDEPAGAAFADLKVVAAAHVSAYDDLPAVPGFEDLDALARQAAVDRSNRTRCDCGCAGHTVAACLHQSEACDVAMRLATAFVDDARAASWAMGGGEPGEATGATGTGVPTSTVDAPAPAPAAEPPREDGASGPASALEPAPPAPQLDQETTDPKPGDSP